MSISSVSGDSFLDKVVAARRHTKGKANDAFLAELEEEAKKNGGSINMDSFKAKDGKNHTFMGVAYLEGERPSEQEQRRIEEICLQFVDRTSASDRHEMWRLLEEAKVSPSQIARR